MNEWEYKTCYLGLERVDDPRSPSYVTALEYERTQKQR